VTTPSPGSALNPIYELVKNQPWYKKAAPFLTGVVGSAISVLWVATTFGIDVPDSAEKWVLAGILFLTSLGIYQVPRGITEGQLKQVEEAYVGKHRKPE